MDDVAPISRETARETSSSSWRARQRKVTTLSQLPTHDDRARLTQVPLPIAGNRRLPDPREQPTITVEHAAAILGIARGGAYEAVRNGTIPSIRIGRRLLVPTARVAALLGVDQ